MQKKNIAIMDIGSSKITVMVASKGISNSFRILGMGECEYAGYVDGKFLDYDSLKLAISMAVTNAQKSLKFPIAKLVVGMPAEFTYLLYNKAEVNFESKRKIQQNDIFDLLDNGNASKNDKNSLLIKCVPSDYIIDSVKNCSSAIGVKATKFSSYISYLFADKKVIDIINDYLKAIEINSVEYVSTAYAEYQYYFKTENAVLVDCGYLSTSVAYGVNGVLNDLKSFSLGGANITADLFDVFSLPFSTAETLKRKLILTLKPKMTDTYTINDRQISVKDANEVALCRINQIAKTINKCIENVSNKDVPIYLTGGGLAYIRGIKECLSDIMKKEVEIIEPPLPQYAKPHFSSLLGILSEVFASEEKKKWSFLDFIKKKM